MNNRNISSNPHFQQRKFDFCFAPSQPSHLENHSRIDFSKKFKKSTEEQSFQPLSNGKDYDGFDSISNAIQYNRNPSSIRSKPNSIHGIPNNSSLHNFESQGYSTPTRAKFPLPKSPNTPNNDFHSTHRSNSNLVSPSTPLYSKNLDKSVFPCEIHEEKCAKYFIHEQNQKHYLCSKCAVKIAMRGGKPIELKDCQENNEKTVIKAQINEFLECLTLLEEKSKLLLRTFPPNSISTFLNELAMMRFDVEENQNKIVEKISLNDFKSIIEDYRERIEVYGEEIDEMVKMQRLDSQDSRDDWGSQGNNSLYFSFDNKDSLKSEFFSEQSTTNLFNSNFSAAQYEEFGNRNDRRDGRPVRYQTEDSDKENGGLDYYNYQKKRVEKKEKPKGKDSGKYQKLLDKVQQSQLNTSNLVSQIRSNHTSPSVSPSNSLKRIQKPLKTQILYQNNEIDEFERQLSSRSGRNETRIDFEEKGIKARRNRSPFQVLNFNSPRFNH